MAEDGHIVYAHGVSVSQQAEGASAQNCPAQLRPSLGHAVGCRREIVLLLMCDYTSPEYSFADFRIKKLFFFLNEYG